MSLYGGAFQKIVTSLVNDIVMPAISILTGNVDFSNLTLSIGSASIKYGAFLTTVLDFLLIAFSIFLIIRYINKLNKKLEEVKEDSLKKLEKQGVFKRKKADTTQTSPTTKTCPYCFSEVNIKATRCPHCTSMLVEKKELLEEEQETEKQNTEEQIQETEKLTKTST